MHASQLRWVSFTHLIRNAAHGKDITNTRASDFLRAAADEEETISSLSGGASSKSNSGITNTKTSHTNTNAAEIAQKYPNWTGDESIQDAVLRMLVDKYKPLRSGSIRTAEEKIKEDLKPNAHFIQASFLSEVVPADSIASTSASPSSSPSTTTTTSAAAAAAVETHKPWLTTFRPPSNVASVKYMRLPPHNLLKTSAKESSILNIVNPDDPRGRVIERDRRKKELLAGRLTSAKEGSLDYRLGKTSSARGPNPVSLKGWNSLVEERVERARNEGLFRSIKGRGKPIVRSNEEVNPFISREEFLMNRIVQRQGAAPPWVEFQRELESAITTFRSSLRSTWTRRAIRTLTATNHPAFFSTITLTDITRLRDPEWEKTEQRYHNEALSEINSLVRKYNGAAPYSVRKPTLDRRIELERMYEDCKDGIFDEIGRRAYGGDVFSRPRGFNEDEDDRKGAGNGVGVGDGSAGDVHLQSGRITPSKSMFTWRSLWNKLMSSVISNG